MSDAGDAVDTQIKDAIWTYGGWFVLLTLTLGAGIGIGYIFWGDALLLRAQNNELTLKIRNATQEKENFSLQLVSAQEETRRCQRKLSGEEGPSH
jgi:hypothetical protein